MEVRTLEIPGALKTAATATTAFAKKKASEVAEAVEALAVSVANAGLYDAGADLNIVDGAGSIEYKWTLNTSFAARQLAPRIHVKLLQMKYGQVAQLISQGINIATDPYRGTYWLKDLKTLTLPFFSSQHHANMNEWEQLDLAKITENVLGMKGMGGTIGKVAGAVTGGIRTARNLGVALVSPAFKTETPAVWTNIGLESVSFGFTLYNINEASYKVHKAFVDEMVYWTVPEKFQATFAIPPVLCEYSIPGIRRGLMAHMSFTVTTKGQNSYHNRVNTPDAFECTFKLQDLLMQTKNFNPRSGAGPIEGKIGGTSTTNVYTPPNGTAMMKMMDTIQGAAADGITKVGELITGAIGEDNSPIDSGSS